MDAREDEWQDDWPMVAAPAEMDGRQAVELVRQVLASDADVIVDLTTTRLLTSDGCQALLEMHTSLVHSGRSVVLRVDVSSPVWQVLLVTRLDDHFAILVEHEHERLQQPADARALRP